MQKIIYSVLIGFCLFLHIAVESAEGPLYVLPCKKLSETPAPGIALQKNGLVRAGSIARIPCMELIRGSLRFKIRDPQKFTERFSFRFQVLPEEFDEAVPLVRIYKKELLKSKTEPVAVSLIIQNQQLHLTAGNQKCAADLPQKEGWLHIAVEFADNVYTLYCDNKALKSMKSNSRHGNWNAVELGANLRHIYAEELLIRNFVLNPDPPEKEMELTALSSEWDPDADFREKEMFSTMFEEQQKTYRRLGIRVDSATFARNSIEGEKIDKAMLHARTAILYTALDALPPKFIKKSGIKDIYIVDNLKHNGFHAGGVAAGGDTMYLSSHANAKTIYHELYHLFDEDKEIKRWSSINPRGFKYRGSSIKGDRHLTRRQRKQIRANKINKTYDMDFVSQYAMSFEREDRAETFAFMLQEGPRFKKRFEGSDVMRKKALYIIKTTGTGRLLGADFWEKHLKLDEKDLKKSGKKKQ